MARRSFNSRPIHAALGAFALASAGARSASADPSKLPPEIGWNYGEVETARSAALGGATRAISSAATALFVNPANLVAAQIYHLDAIAQIWPEAKRQSYGAAITDSVTSRLAGGLGGTYTIQDPDGLIRKATDARLGLALPISDKFYVGLAGRYLHARQDGLGPLGPSYASGGLPGAPIVSNFTFDAGLTVRPADFLSLAVVGANLTNPGNGFLPTTFGGGVGVGGTTFSVEGDVVADFTTYEATKVRAMGGGEVLLGDHFPLRVGYRYDQGQQAQYLSGGAGYVDQQFGLDFAIRHSVSGQSVTAIIIGLQVYLESTGLTKTPMDTNGPGGVLAPM